MKKEFSKEIENVKPFVYYEISINDGDYEDYESDICFNDEKDAVSYLKNKADIIFENCEDLNEFDFTKINTDEINIFIEDDGYFGSALHTKIKTKELVCKECKEDILFNRETLYITKQSKFFIENKEK